MRNARDEAIWARLGSQRGSVLLAAYLVIMVLLFLGAAFLVISSHEGRIADNQRKIIQAFYIAEAGIEQAIYDLRQDILVNPANAKWSDGITIGGTTYGPDTAAFYNVYINVPFPSGTYANSFSVSGTNDYTVSFKNAAGTEDVWVRSTGRVDGLSQTIEIYARMVNLSPWDNAIFGGAGSSGAMVNGNVNIRGSVHILGEGLNDGDNAIDLGGTAELVGNHYNIGNPQGLDAALAAKVPALPTTVFNGETVSTLNAELRVKKGLVGLSGNSVVGEANISGNSVKETVDGTYVTDGYNGTKGASGVYSDNGATEGYDLGDAVTFPSLSDPFPANPSQDYYQYFNDNALVLTTELNNVTPNSNFTLGDCSSNCITMDGNGNLHITGMIYVSADNNLSITSGNFQYTGKGTVLVTGNATIDANLVTAGNNSFPTNILGIMTPNNINIGTSSQKDIMGLFYAEGTIATYKQTDIVGTLVTNYFNVSSQVPSVFQVPESVNHLPPGMIAGEPIWLVKVVAWRKI